MLRKMAAMLFTLVLIALFMPNLALADTDNQPPQLTDFSINSGSFNAGDTITVTIHATDDSGVSIDPNKGCVIFKKKSDSNWSCWLEIDKSIDSTTFVASDTIDQNIWQTGDDYYVGSIRLTDTQENTKTYSVQNNDFSESDFSVTNTLRTDWTGPVMTALSVDKTTAIVGDTITFDVTATDPSGLSYGFILLMGAVQKQIYIYSTGSIGEMKGSYVVPSDIPSGDYSIYMVSLQDAVCNVGSSNNWSTYTKLDNLPESMQQTITINNPNVSLQGTNCKLESIDISPKQVKQGDPVTITVHLDPEGNQLSDMCYVRIGPVAWGADSLSTMDFGLNKTADGVYSRSWIFPVNWPTGDYMISDMDLTNSTGQSMQIEYPDAYKGQNYKLAPQVFNIGSVFSGTDNISIQCGDTFDRKAGVSAGNTTEGNLNDKIEVSGDVDTSKVGIYLIKYKIKSSQDPTQFNKTGDMYYYDIRWVGVTEITPPASDDSGTLVVTNDDVTIGADSGDVALSENGSAIDYSQTISTPGSYTVSAKQSGGSSASLAAFAALKTNACGKESAKFIIDRTGPNIASSYQVVSLNKTNVTTTCTDAAGIAETKYMTGSKTLSEVKNGGMEFDGAFTLNGTGCYTIYARDMLGNESVKTISIQYAAVKSVSLNIASADLPVGNSLQLKATINPSNALFRAVSWSSSNSKVATVDANGIVCGVSTGAAQIIVSTQDGAKTAVCNVKISPVLVKSVSISSSYKSVFCGSQFTLTASAIPANAANKSITWSSSNKKVATVDSHGNVKTIGVGTAYIYAKSCNGKTAACKVVVKPVAVTRVVLSRSQATLAKGTSIQLSVKIYPTNATDKTITWSSNNQSVAIVDSTGHVKALKRGKATIYAKTANGKVVKCIITVK